MTHGADGIAGTGDELSLPQNSHLAFMVLTRATPSGDVGKSTRRPRSSTRTRPTPRTPRTRCSCASTSSVGRPPGGHRPPARRRSNGSSLPTWADVKEQARDVLGIELTDRDVGNIPLLRTDPYGEFIRGAERPAAGDPRRRCGRHPEHG